MNAATQPFRIVFRPHPAVLPYLHDVPFELLKLDADRLALHPLVRGIVHSYKRHREVAAPPAAALAAGLSACSSSARDPKDLGGDDAAPCCPSAIASSRSRAGAELADVVEVAVLSSEAGAGGPVTYDAFRAELRNDALRSPSRLPGARRRSRRSGSRFPPIGVLLFEARRQRLRQPDPRRSAPERASTGPCRSWVLAGCMTAAGEVLR